MLKITKLISEDGKNFSLGRISFWVAFFIAIHKWIMELAFPPSLFEFLVIAFLYNLGKKAVRAYEIKDKYPEERGSKRVPQNLGDDL
jgi:hypothetical protein